jgi:triacylglycerol lipase
LKSQHIILIHGLFGWGKNELGGLPYWGYAGEVAHPGFTVHESSCGPVSSFYDRACEVAAQIKGAPIDYGAEHSAAEGHSQFSEDYTDKGFVPDWSENNPVIIIGHSAGGHTALRLQQLLADDFWGWGSNANWIEAVICLSPVLNGSTLPYMLGCDKQSGLLIGSFGPFLGKAIQFFAMAGGGSIDNIFDFDLDQWIGMGKGGSFQKVVSALDKSNFAKGKDNLAFDLTIQGGYEANQAFQTDPQIYYLSLVTEQTTKGWFTSFHYPDPLMNPSLAATAAYQGVVVDFDNSPIPGWGSGDLVIEKWRENDGAVSSISQRYPFTAGNHPVGGEGIFERDHIERGKWYYEKVEDSTGRSFDHLDVGFGCFTDPSLIGAQKKLYRNIFSLLQKLP